MLMIAYCNIALSLPPDSDAVYLALLVLSGDICIPRIISAFVDVLDNRLLASCICRNFATPLECVISVLFIYVANINGFAC